MKSGTKHMFFGILIATFNIKMGGLTILPAFVGWMVVASGLSKLAEYAPESAFLKIRPKAYLLVGAALLGSLLSLSAGGSPFYGVPLALYGVVVMYLELVLFHSILDGAVERYQALGRTQEADLFAGKDRTYLVLMGTALVLVTLGIAIPHGGATFGGAILAIVTRIYLLTVISALGKEEEEMEPLEGEESSLYGARWPKDEV